MKIVSAQTTYISGKLKAPFGFKGGYVSDIWQTVCKVETQKTLGVGVGVQSVLWSDANVFSAYGEEKGNCLMYQISQKAVELLQGREGDTPIDLIDGIYAELFAYAKSLISENLRETFVKNALVCVDNALWQAYGKECNEQDIMRVIPQEYVGALSVRHQKLCNIPLITYGVQREEIGKFLQNGTVLLKIKIGNDNGKSKEEMLAWDKKRLAEIHQIASKYKTEYTTNGNILYYLDANGRYDNVNRLQSLLEYAQEIGAMENIVLLEEPFDEENKIDVSALPVRIVADESVHAVKDVEERIALGYQAIALKPIAKTLSETLKILKVASEHNIVCFCADLTVNPLLVEWNKNIASRIPTLPEMKIGILESNGEQNYVNWTEMQTYSPSYKETFSLCENGVYTLNEKFFNTSGGIFQDSNYYKNLF